MERKLLKYFPIAFILFVILRPPRQISKDYVTFSYFKFEDLANEEKNKFLRTFDYLDSYARVFVVTLSRLLFDFLSLLLCLINPEHVSFIFNMLLFTGSDICYHQAKSINYYRLSNVSLNLRKSMISARITILRSFELNC